MRLSRSSRQILTHALAILLGALLTFGTLKVMPSQADPVSDAKLPEPIARVSRAFSDNFVAAAVQQVGPAVVRLDTERVVNRQVDPLFDDPFFRRFLGDDFFPRVPRQERRRGQGSGFIVDASGIILTNAHVVSDADQVTVTLKDGRRLEGEVRGTDDVTDLAVVKVDNEGVDLPIVSLGDSDQVQVGDWAIAVGNPLGLNNTVTLGIISTLSRSSAQVGIPEKRVDFLQTDAAINPGNSGGPLLNEQGEVIGINTAIRRGAEGIGFAVPINDAKAIQDQLARGEKIARPFVGIQMATLSPEIIQRNNEDPNSGIILPEGVTGVLILRVLPDTPADAAGLRRGDVITKIDTRVITNADQLQKLVGQSRVGQLLRFEVIRNNETLTISVRTGELET